MTKPQPESMVFPVYQPALDDHIQTQFRQTIFHPFIDGVWTGDYSAQVAKYIADHPRPENGKIGTYAQAGLLLNQDWFKDKDITTLENLHLGEAASRDVSPWVLQQVIYMQELQSHRGIRPDSLIDQRTQIIEHISQNVDLHGNNYDEIGTTVSSFLLASPHYWILKEVSPEQSEIYLREIKSKFAQNLYHSEIQAQVGRNLAELGMVGEAEANIKSIYHQSNLFNSEFFTDLPKDIKRRFFRRVDEYESIVVKEKIKTGFDSIKNRARNFFSKHFKKN